MKSKIKQNELEQLLAILSVRFEKNMSRHSELKWIEIEDRLRVSPDKAWSVLQMEKTGGEPDVVSYSSIDNTFVFMDCSSERPIGRRSYCYDREALESRKANKPQNCVLDIVNEMGLELLNEEEYRNLQKIVVVDKKTSSWVLTPKEIREQGGALFCDYRYGKVFVYHNGADSYYSNRGFRTFIRI